jgi:hypothetical protein
MNVFSFEGIMFRNHLSQFLFCSDPAGLMQNDSVSVLDADHAAFMQRGISIGIATCDQHNVPSQVRATGCRISADRRCVTIFISAIQAARVVADVRSNGVVAAVFSEPSTHRTVQVKGHDANVSAIADGDLLVVDAYRDAFARELEPLGFNEVIIRALLACPSADLVAVSFTPTAAFSQTPGPNAGEPLRTGA